MDSRNQSFGMLGVRNGSSINSNTNRNTSGTSQVPETNNPGIEGNQKGSAVPNEPSKQEVEQLVENNPEAVKAATPVDNPIHKEAEQVTDGDARTTEANNEKIKEGIKKLSKSRKILKMTNEELLDARKDIGGEPDITKPVQDYELADDYYYIDPSKTSREEFEDRNTFDKILKKWLGNSESEMGEDPEKLKKHFQYNFSHAADDYGFDHNTDRYAKCVENFQERNRKAEESVKKHRDWLKAKKEQDKIEAEIKARGLETKPDLEKPVADKVEEAEQRLDDNPNNDEVNNAKIKEGIKALSNEEEYKLNNPEPDLYPYGKAVYEGDRKDLLNHAIDYQEKWGGNFEQEAVPTIYNLKGSPEFGEDPNLVKNNFAAAMKNWRFWNDANESNYLADANEDKRKRWRKHEKWRKGLEKAIAKDKAKPVADKVEEVIEERPEAVKNDPLMPKEAKKEATQVTDGDARTDEANNEAVEKTIEKLSEDFDTVDDLYDYLENVYDPEVPNEPVQSTGGIDWSKVKEYKPGEDSYGRVADFDENAPDFPVDNDMSKWNRDEDLDEALDEVTEEIFDPGLEDLNQYNDAINEEELHKNDETLVGAQSDIPVTPEEQFEPAPEAPYADNVVQMKEEQDLDQAIDEALDEPTNINLPKETLPTVNHGSGASGGGNVSGDPVRIPGSSFGSVFRGGSPFRSGTISSGSVSAASPSAHTIPNQTKGITTHSTAGGGGRPAEVPKQGTSSNPIGGSKSSGNVISNGATYSGGTNKTSRSLKYVPSSKILPRGGERMESYDVEAIGNSPSSGNEATLNNIESRVKSIQPWALAEQLGFSSKYKHISYNGTSIDQLSPEQIREIEKILDTLGV